MNLKIRLFLLLLLNSFFAGAQFKVAIFGGPQATSAHYSVNGTKQPVSYKYGFMAGAGLKVPFDHQLFFFPSIYYSLKGYKVTLNNPAFPPTQYAKNNNTTIHTVNLVPMFHIDFSTKPSHVFIRFGPEIDFAISGRERFDTVSVSGTSARVDRAMVFSFGDYGRISASANLHLGFENAAGFMIFGFLEYGIGSMNNADGGPRIYHRIFGLSVGKMFGKF